MQQLVKREPTPQAKKLYEALKNRGVHVDLEYRDGFKTVDMAIKESRIYIEVDGLHHFTDPDTILRDFKRYHFSDGDDFSTFYITNQIIDSQHFDDVVDALIKVVEIKSKT